MINFSEIDFVCCHCNKEVSKPFYIGTKHRNHCPFCLWSRHVDKVAGDRKSHCGWSMKPIGLTQKKSGYDKKGKKRKGELMVVHLCTNKSCSKISINRIAGDDDEGEIISLCNKRNFPDFVLKKIAQQNISLLTVKDIDRVKTQLFGKKV